MLVSETVFQGQGQHHKLCFGDRVKILASQVIYCSCEQCDRSSVTAGSILEEVGCFTLTSLYISLNRHENNDGVVTCFHLQNTKQI